jgi:hypothetical protein
LQGIDPTGSDEYMQPLTVAYQIMQRFDLDGDYTINKDEFILGFKFNQYVAHILINAFKRD